MTRRSSIAWLILVMVTPFPATESSVGASGVTELCFGQVPTIVGAVGEDITGTDGPDVVLSNGGAYQIDTGKGADLVCVVGVPADPGPMDYIMTGPGRDRVDTSKSGFNHTTTLGAGADEYRGGPAYDAVYAGGGRGADTATDVVKTAGGDDGVYSGGGSDVVKLGSGSDFLTILGAPSDDAILLGGRGTDSLGIDLLALGPDLHSWALDNHAERLLSDGQPLGGWHSFTHFRVAARGPIKFLGSELPEALYVVSSRFQKAEAGWLPSEPLDVRMRGGDDVVIFRGGAHGGRFDGGKGTDKIQYWVEIRGRPGRHFIRVDLSKGNIMDATASGTETTWPAVDFENATGGNYSGGQTLLRGTSGPNLLNSLASDPATIYGLAGDDVLDGSYGPDLLIGGSGHDVAIGRNGIDRCGAEVRELCEQSG